LGREKVYAAGAADWFLKARALLKDCPVPVPVFPASRVLLVELSPFLLSWIVPKRARKLSK
jgi:hypothetical protein